MRQSCTLAHVAFDDESVADFFDEQVDQERQPEQFARIWIHSHPGDCPLPSMTDEETFTRVFGASDWAVMFIVARGGQTFSRLRFNVGPGGQHEIPVRVDFNEPFAGSDHDAWENEYLNNVQNMDAAAASPTSDVADSPATRIVAADEFWPWDDEPDEWTNQTDLDDLEQQERMVYE